jgi:hypothetical protein
MRKIYPQILLLLLVCLTSCGGYVSSPAIDFENSSAKGEIVRNIKVLWNGYKLLGSSEVGRCATHEQNFALRRQSDFFGPVHIEWENAKGKKLIKDIIFTKKDFPTFKRSQFGPHVYHYVVLYFTQEDVEIYTSDNLSIKKIRKEKSGDWMIIAGKCVNDPKEAARVRALFKKYPIISTVTGKPIDED